MRSGRAPWLVGALVWLLVVAAVGSVTYLVVDRAGRGVGGTSHSEPLAVATASASPRATPRPSRSTRTPTRTPSPAPTPRTSSTRAPAPSTTVPASSVPAATAAPTPSATTAAPRTSSFSTRGGTVVATCVDGSVRLDSITVRDGWRFEREVEDGYVEVKFDAEEAEEIELTIGCRGGVPVRVDD